jgi:TRAP-type C4-dicarboxylate transport system permease small subunit
VKRGPAALLDLPINALGGLGAVATVLLVGITFVTVIWRYVLGQPIYGIDDIAKMTLVATVACSLAYGARRHAHVKVDILDKVGGRNVTRFTDIFARLIGIATLAFTAKAVAVKGSCGLLCGNATADLTIPHMPFYMLLAAGFSLYALVLVLELVAGLRAWSEPRDPHEEQ